MHKRIVYLALSVSILSACSEKTASKAEAFQPASALVHQYLRIDQTKELSEENIREAVLKLVPRGASMEQIFELFEKTGLGPSHCAPGEYDDTPFAGMPYCGFRSSEKSCGAEYANYNIHFVMKNNPAKRQLEPGDTWGFRDVKVNRWVSECRK